jgi:hypothetical protein
VWGRQMVRAPKSLVDRGRRLPVKIFSKPGSSSRTPRGDLETCPPGRCSRTNPQHGPIEVVSQTRARSHAGQFPDVTAAAPALRRQGGQILCLISLPCDKPFLAARRNLIRRATVRRKGEFAHGLQDRKPSSDSRQFDLSRNTVGAQCVPGAYRAHARSSKESTLS